MAGIFRLNDVRVESIGSKVKALVTLTLDNKPLSSDVAMADTANEAIFAAIARIIAPKAEYRIMKIVVDTDSVFPYYCKMELDVAGYAPWARGEAHAGSPDEAQYKAFISAISSIL